jgi:hypothetical protein
MIFYANIKWYIHFTNLKLTVMKDFFKFTATAMLLLLTTYGFSKKPGPVKNNNQLYLTTNKELYVPAETICFQAFLVNARATISTSIFTELYDCSGNKILSKKLPLENNMAAGSFVLPALANDYYLLYCYILGSNGKPELDFIKKVAIQESAIVSSTSVNKNFNAADLNVEYYFEGGNFVNELNNNVLIKTSTRNNSPISVSGKIINQKNEVISIFNTNEQGFININVIPFKNEKCAILIKDNLGNVKDIPMPAAAEEGISFRMFTFEKSVFYTAQLLAQSYSTPLNYTLEVLQDNQLIFQSDLKFDEGKSQLNEEINNQNLPEGYLNFRIRDVNKKVYVDRLYYNSNSAEKSNAVEINDTVNHKIYSVALPDYVSGTGCISINAVEKNKNSLLQTGNYRFGQALHLPELNQDINFSKYNDYLISVKDISAGSNDSINTATNLLTLGGTLYSQENTIVKNKKVNIIIKESKSKSQFYEASTDKNGRLQIDNLLFFDTATVYYQLADKSEGKNSVKLVLDKIPNVYVAEGNEKIKDFLCVTANDISSKIIKSAIIDSSKNSKTLSEVIVKTKLAPEKTDKENFVEKYVSPKANFSGFKDEFDFITNPKEALNNETIEEFLRSKITSLRIDIDYANLKTKLFNPNVINPFNGAPAPVQVYLDDTQIDENGTVFVDFLTLRIADIALIRYYGLGFRPNPGGPSGGTIMIYTRKGDEHSDKPVVGLPKLKIAGYDSDISQVDNAKQPAGYKTLYWKPNYSFGGKAIIYTSFLPETNNKNIEIKIEGINNDKIPFTFIKNIVPQ